MNLEEAQKKIWIQQPDAPQTTQEALARVSQTMIDCIGAFQDDQLVTAQTYLEDTLAQILVAMKTLNVEPSRALERAVERMTKEAAQPRVFHVYADRVEIQVGADIRGGWPLFSNEDYEAVIALARTFGCHVTHHEAQQLDLFSAGKTPKRTQPTLRNRVPNYFAPSSTSNRPRLTLIASE